MSSFQVSIYICKQQSQIHTYNNIPKQFFKTQSQEPIRKMYIRKPRDMKATPATTIQSSAQVSPEIETPRDSDRPRRDLSIPPPPLLPIIEAMLDKFYLVGESVEKIHAYVEAQGVFISEIAVYRILGTYRDPPTIRHSYKFPSTSAGIVTSEAEAQKRVDEQMRMFRFILGLAKEGKSVRWIKRMCIREGYQLEGHFLELLVMHGKEKKNRPPCGGCLGLQNPVPGTWWWGGW